MAEVVRSRPKTERRCNVEIKIAIVSGAKVTVVVRVDA